MNFITVFFKIKKKFFLNKKLVFIVSLLTITLLSTYILFSVKKHSAIIILTLPDQGFAREAWSLESSNSYLRFRLYLKKMENESGNKLKLWDSIHDQDTFFFALTKILDKETYYTNFKRNFDVITQKLNYTATINGKDEKHLEIEKKKFYNTLKDINLLISNQYINHIENLMLPSIDIELENNNSLLIKSRAGLNEQLKELNYNDQKSRDYLTSSQIEAILKIRIEESIKLKNDVKHILEIIKSGTFNFIRAEETKLKNNLNFQDTTIAVLLSFILWIVLILIGNYSIDEYRNHTRNKK